MSTCNKKTKPKVAFVHNILSIGGAEKLIIDCASSLADKGCEVTIFTTFYDPNNCFEETKYGKFKIVEIGRFLPLRVFRRFGIVISHIRSLLLSVRAFRGEFDILFCDLNPLPIKIAKLFRPELKCLYYCHYPDLLLTDRKSFVKKVYRLFFDYIEEKCISSADKILVNSKFTLDVFKKTFPSIQHTPEVLYPTTFFKKNASGSNPVCAIESDGIEKVQKYLENNSETKIITSINRYERKKNIVLAIQTLSVLFKNSKFKGNVKLLIAGGYNTLNKENVEHFDELKELALRSGMKISIWPCMDSDVVFLRSFSAAQKSFIFAVSQCVLYTPSNEHFGIVPIETMVAKLPVIAVNSGGPTESIVHGQTGYLCEPTADAFANAVTRILSSPEEKRNMGEQGCKHVSENFSIEKFEEIWSVIVDDLYKQVGNKKASEKNVMSCRRRFALCFFLFAALLFLQLVYYLLQGRS